MFSNIPLRIARFLLLLWFGICFVVPAARAQTATALNGVYNGKYTCRQGATNLKLSLMASAAGDVSALFTFYLPPGTQKQGYTYSLRGQYNPQTAKFSLTPVRWETEAPANFGMVGMNGTFDSNELTGAITGGACSTFNVERDQTESANIVSVMIAQKNVARPDTPPPAQEAYAAAMQAQAPASAQPSASAAAPVRSQRAQAQPVPPEPSMPPPRAQNTIQPAAAPAGAPVIQASSIKYFCYSTDPQQAVVYFSDVFDVPDAGGKADNFLTYMKIELNFQKYLLEKYKYNPSAEEPVNCVYLAVERDQEKSVAETVAAKKQSIRTETAAAKKQIVETSWKFAGTSSTIAAASTPAVQQVAQQRSAQSPAQPAAKAPAGAKAQSGTKAGNGALPADPQRADDVAKSSQKAEGAVKDADKSFAQMLASPLLNWGMDSQKDALTGEVTTKPKATKFFPGANGKLAGYVTTTASCGNNGVSVFFLAGAGSNDPVPQYAWYTDDSDNSGEQVADVRILVDGGGVHVAQGYPNKEGHTLYTNWLGLLFYEPNLAARVARDQEDRANTGILALDGLIAPMVRQAAQANAQGWADNSAGPLTNLLNARSIRAELPIMNWDTKPVVDLNPQDKVLHQFVTDCNAKFGGGSSPRPAAPSAPPAAQRMNTK